MEWLTNLLGFAGQGSSPFGQLSGSTAMTPPGGGAQPAAPPATMPPQPSLGGVGTSGTAMGNPVGGGMQMPGLLGKIMGQQGQPGGQNLGTGTNGALLNQALGLMKPPQMQVPQMNLLSGPRG